MSAINGLSKMLCHIPRHIETLSSANSIWEPEITKNRDTD